MAADGSTPLGDGGGTLPNEFRHGVRVVARRSVPRIDREVTLFLGGRGDRAEERTVRASNHVRFDDVVVTVREDDESPLTPLLESRWSWPMEPRLVAREVRRDLRRMRATLGPAERHPRHILHDARWQDANNMAHMLLDVLPLCLWVQDELGAEARSVFYELQPLFRRVLATFGVRYSISSRRLRGTMARVRGTRGLTSYDAAGVDDVAGITLVPHVYDRFEFRAPFRAERIFLARRDGRRLANHDEVERLLSKRGFRTIYNEDYTVEEQLGLGQHAKHCVSIHGAGMATLVMSRGMESVIELLMPHSYHEYFALCLDRQVKRYVQILPELDEHLVHRGFDALEPFKAKPIRVDLDALGRALDLAGA